MIAEKNIPRKNTAKIIKKRATLTSEVKGQRFTSVRVELDNAKIKMKLPKIIYMNHFNKNILTSLLI
jgi:hypothetical protein